MVSCSMLRVKVSMSWTRYGSRCRGQACAMRNREGKRVGVYAGRLLMCGGRQ